MTPTPGPLCQPKASFYPSKGADLGALGDDNPAALGWDPSEAVARAARGELHGDVVLASTVHLKGLSALTGLLIGLVTLLWANFHVAPHPSDGATVKTLLFACGVSALWFAVSKVSRLKASAQLDLGHVFLFILTFLLGLARHQGDLDLSPVRAIAPSALLIVSFAALVPATPRIAVAVCFGAASMDLLAWIFVHGSASMSTEPEWPLLLLSPVLSGAVGAGVSRVVHQLRQGIQAAQEVGSYRLLEPLGTGGMAEVWRAEHNLLARPAAVKLIRPDVLLAHGPQSAERLLRLFLREAKATSLLSSPHTILLYDFGITREGSFYYVMELLRGMDLKKLVETFGPQSSERTAYLLSQVCRSLAEAHARKFVHRDLKPANVFTCKLGEDYDFVKVLDFGLVLDRHPTAEELEEQTNFVGTPAIMAPEMIRFHANVDARADIYGIGCIGYWLLTGRHVFEAASRADMLVMHAHQKPIPPSRLSSPSKQARPAFDPGLEALLMSCLEKNPDKRPQSASELGESLTALQFTSPWTPERARLWWRREKLLESLEVAGSAQDVAAPKNSEAPGAPEWTLKNEE